MATKATRYSGSLKIVITLQDNADDFKAVLSADGYLCTLEGLRPSPMQRRNHGLDSDQTFTEIARSAVSFAADQGGTDDVYAHAATDDAGEVLVVRKGPGKSKNPSHEKSYADRHGQVMASTTHAAFYEALRERNDTVVVTRNLQEDLVYIFPAAFEPAGDDWSWVSRPVNLGGQVNKFDFASELAELVAYARNGHKALINK